MKDNVVHTFYGLFSVCFTFVILNVIIRAEYFKASAVIPVAALCLALLFAVYKLLGRYEGSLDKHYNKILIAFAVIMFIAEVAAGITLRYTPAWDIGAIHNGAIEWVRTGTFEGYYKYFYECPNNIGPMAFLFVFFKIANLFGITDYFAVSVVITSAMLVLSMVLVSLICRRLSDTKSAVLALILFAVSVQYYFMGGAVYTDALSMLFPVLIFWLYLKSKEAQGRKKIYIYLLMGLAAAVGSLNKFTVMIMIIAIVIDMCLNYNVKEILKAAVCFAGVIALVMLSFNSYMYSKHLNDSAMREACHRPYTHWVMMGLKGDGRYNGSDFTLTDSANPQERDAIVKAETIHRLKALGASGMIELAGKKSAFDFGDGTYGIADFFHLSPKNNTKLHDWVLEDGKHYTGYGIYVSAIQLAVLIIMLAGAFAAKDKLLPLYLSFFGVWLFLMCWETNRRYFSNFAPVMFTMAVLGVDTVTKLCGSVRQRIK